MTKHVLISALLLGACYGAGDPPGTPGDITVLLATETPGDPNFCSGNAQYIADFVVAGQMGYAVTMPYFPNNSCSCNGGSGCGGGGQGGNGQIIQFSTQADTPMMVGSFTLQNGNSVHPHVSQNGNYAVVNIGQGGQIAIEPGNYMTPPPSQTFGGLVAVGLVDDGGAWYVAGTWQSMTGSTEIESPDFFSNSIEGNATNSYFAVVTPTGSSVLPIPITSPLACDLAKDCFVGQGPNLYYITTNLATHQFEVFSYVKGDTTGTSVTKLAAVSPLNEAAVMGIAVETNHVVWSISNNWRKGQPNRFCQVYSYDLTTMQTTTILDTSAFSCLDVAADADGAYTVIAELEPSGTDQEIHGIGLAQATFDGMVNTRRVTVSGQGRGPRRIAVQGGNRIYLADPTVLVWVKKAVLANQNDFPL